MVHDVLPRLALSVKVPRPAVWSLQSPICQLLVVIAAVSKIHFCSENVGSQRQLSIILISNGSYLLVRISAAPVQKPLSI